MRNRRLISVLAVSLLWVVWSTTASAEDNKQKKDTAIEPTNWGRVLGQIYDAQTGAPIENAVVCIQQEGTFASRGKTVGQTDAMGRYQCEAIIGRVSANLDVGRLLNTGLIGLLGGGATNKTKRVDITRLNLRVAKDGYKAFEGVVMCRAVAPERFSVTMEPVLLTGASSTATSTCADGWGVVRIASVAIEPAVLGPNTKATITVQVQSPPIIKLHDMKVICVSELWGRKEMKSVREPSDGRQTFALTVTAPKDKKPYAGLLLAYILESPYDIAAPGNIFHQAAHAETIQELAETLLSNQESYQKAERQQSIVISVANDDNQRKIASSRAEAYRLLQSGDNAAADARFKDVCAQPDATVWDFESLAEVSESLHDNATAMTAWKRAVDLTPLKPEERRRTEVAHYADALLTQGESAKALGECSTLVESVKERDRPKHIPLPLMVSLGNAYVKENRLSEADTISQQLLKWPNAGLYPGTSEFRNALRLAQAQAKLKEDPASAQAHAEYARTLMDQGRWEEGVNEARAALRIAPNLLAVQRDLAYAMLHITSSDAADRKEDLDSALTAAEEQTQVRGAKGKTIKSKDFLTWHAYGMLLYAKARRQQETSDPSGAATFTQCAEALKEALKCGRTGADVNQGAYSIFFGYTSPRVTAISGFAYPQANSDFIILESLRTLEKSPDDYLALFNLGTSLVDLGQPALAVVPIQRVRELKPAFAEAQYVAALIALQTGDREAATKLLRDVIDANPCHPHANLTLAKLYTEDGDMAAAASCLAAHGKVYGMSK